MTPFPDNVLTKPKRQWPPCPKCDEPRGEHQHCRNGCDTWTASPVGTPHGVTWMDRFTTRGGPIGGLAEYEK